MELIELIKEGAIFFLLCFCFFGVVAGFTPLKPDNESIESHDNWNDNDGII